MFSFDATFDGGSSVPCQGLEAMGGGIAKMAASLMRPAAEEVMPAATPTALAAPQAETQVRPLMQLFGLEAMGEPLYSGMNLAWLRAMSLGRLRHRNARAIKTDKQVVSNGQDLL